MDDDTAGDNTSTREMLYGAGGNNNVFYDSTGPLTSSTSCRQGMNPGEGSNFLSAGFGQSTGYWTGNEVQIPAAAVPRVRPPLKSMTQAQPQQVHPSHATNMNIRINQVPRHYYENSLQPGQHSNSNSNTSGILPPGYEAARPQQMGQLAVMEQQSVMLEDLFGSPAGMGVMSRQQAAHQQGLKDYSAVHHQQQQQFQTAGASAAGMRPFMVENSPSLPVGLDFFNGEPFDGSEFWAIDSNVFGGQMVQQHRNSLTPDPLMFHQRPMAPTGGSGANQPYQIAHATYDPTIRSAATRGRHDVAPPPRTWVPSQLTYDNTPNMNTTLVAPPRTSGARASGSSSSRKAIRQAPDAEVERKRPRANYSPMAGENRLKISFVGLGTPGESPQHFGTKGFIIPDGLSGMHQVYHQRWRFDIRHEKIEDTICVSWSITNMASGTTCSRTETPREARVRETSGHTICNQLLRQALKSRAQELEQSLLSLRDNPTKYSNTESLIKALRPKSCILGLLFFGLLHDCVQQRMKEMVRNPSAMRIERPIIPQQQQPSVQQEQQQQQQQTPQHQLGMENIPIPKLDDEQQPTTRILNEFGEDLGGNGDTHGEENGGDAVEE